MKACEFCYSIKHDQCQTPTEAGDCPNLRRKVKKDVLQLARDIEFHRQQFNDDLPIKTED